MTILVAMDLSVVSRRALDVVQRTFPREGLRVVILHVAEPEPEFVGWTAGPDAVRDQVARGFRQERRAIEDMAAALRQAGIDAIGLTVQGAIVATVVAEAERLGADLVAVGSHSHGPAYDLAVGSVSAGIIRKSAVPVLVVPDRA